MYRKLHIVICGFFSCLTQAPPELRSMKQGDVVWCGLSLIQAAVIRKRAAWAKDRIAYLGGKTVSNTCCLKGYALKITECIQMIIFQQGICCSLRGWHTGIWDVCQRTHMPRQTREHSGNRDCKGPAKLCSASWWALLVWSRHFFLYNVLKMEFH